MRYLVLESFVGSEYEDSPSSYEFPSRYLRLFASLEQGEPVFAVIYEPRGGGGGRMAYVGWATISEPPEPSSRSLGGARLWTVRYDDRYFPFERAVPREVAGEPIEALLRALPRGRERNVATLGRAVRAISESDVHAILEMAYGGPVNPNLRYPSVTVEEAPVAERTRRLVATVQRESRFRDLVLRAYGYQCAVSGFAVGTRAAARSFGLVDAAHIRPVLDMGSDSLSNGLALTPTLHRLFDRGLFTARYEAGRLALEVSPHLQSRMIESPDGTSRIRLEPGMTLSLPSDPREWPDPVQLAYHSNRIFLAGSP